MKNRTRFSAAIFFSGTFLMPKTISAAEGIGRSIGISDGFLLALMLGIIVLLLGVIYALAKSIAAIGLSKAQDEKEELKNPKDSGATLSIIAILILMGSSLASQAQTVETPKIPVYSMSQIEFWLLAGMIIFEFIVIGIFINVLNTLIKLRHKDAFEEKKEIISVDIFKNVKLTDRVPVAEEADILLDHEYDGIKELDNNLPPWWKYMFYATIVFAFVYLIRFHITGGGKLSHEEYIAEVNAAVAAKAELMAEVADNITEENVIYLVDAPSLQTGAAIFKGNCATCHGQLGEGGAGPNLTDEYWLHGGNVQSVFKTIKYGVPAKGMIAWQSQFNPKQMQQLASYVLSLKGSNPPNGKAPQGEIYVEEIITKNDSVQTDSTQMDTLGVVIEIEPDAR